MPNFPAVTALLEGSPLLIPAEHFRPSQVTESAETVDTISTATVSCSPSTLMRPGGVPPLLKAIVEQDMTIIFEMTVILSKDKETEQTEPYIRIDPLSVFVFRGRDILHVEDSLLDQLSDIQVLKIHT